MAEPSESCGHLLGELSAYLDGTAAAKLCDEIEAHMADCPDCKILVDTLRKTITLYREQEAHLPLPEGARIRLFKRLQLDDFLPK